MIKELIKLSDHLDRKGYFKESDYLDAIIKMAGDEDHEEGQSSEPQEPKQSKWHKMKMLRVVDEMDKNDFNSLSFEIGSYTIRVTKNREEDCD